ncbi:tudor and KH domain containing protein papi [Calliopsis andreniformis]|uniref:tudor and KH domain containing protein papi n=1 Tax=Calliopsis andreniformis TaxID=337506 RepID=UPI003FCC6BED
MKWMSRQLNLPLILGVSLTGVGIALIYLLYKKDKEDTASRRNHIQIPKRITIECKIPRQFVPAIIGRGGSVIKDVQNKTGTQIYFKEDNVECPERICFIKGTFEAVHLAEEVIKSIIINQPIIETYEMYVPQKACGRIIGKGGESIQQIQTTSSAKVIVESGFGTYNPDAERRIIIKGTAEQIASALSQIEDKVREEKEMRAKLEASSTTRLPRGKLSPRNTAVNTTEPLQSTESLPTQGTDGVMEVYVSAMESPSQFWIQIVGSGTTALDKLVSEMTAYYNEEENHELHTLKDVTVGRMVAAKFSFDEQWYRAEVISVLEEGLCEVYFVDYGDHEVVQLGSIFELRTDFLSLRLQAIECSLANVKPRGNEWSTEACDRFAELAWLAQWKILVAKVRRYKERAFSYGISRREGSPIPCLELFDKNDDKDINIGQELINEGFAELEETLSSAASSTLSLSTRSHDMTTISSPASSSPVAKRALSPETPANTPRKLDSTTESSIDTLDTSIVDVKSSSRIEEIDLVTPRKAVGSVEEIDLVTPVKDETNRFIENEKKARGEDGGGDYMRNGSSNNQKNRERNSKLKVNKLSQIAPAGYESDLSDDSDELELGAADASRTIFRGFLSAGKSRELTDDRKNDGTKPSWMKRGWRWRKERCRKLLRWNENAITIATSQTRRIQYLAVETETCGRGSVNDRTIGSE